MRFEVMPVSVEQYDGLAVFLVLDDERREQAQLDRGLFPQHVVDQLEFDEFEDPAVLLVELTQHAARRNEVSAEVHALARRISLPRSNAGLTRVYEGLLDVVDTEELLILLRGVL